MGDNWTETAKADAANDMGANEQGSSEVECRAETEGFQFRVEEIEPPVIEVGHTVDPPPSIETDGEVEKPFLLNTDAEVESFAEPEAESESGGHAREPEAEGESPGREPEAEGESPGREPEAEGESPAREPEAEGEAPVLSGDGR
jgi:hypothetical protein